MTDATLTPKMRTWTDDLNNVGRVEIKADFSSLIWRIGLAVAIAAAVMYFRYQAGDIGEQTLSIAIVGFAILIIGLVVGVRMYWGGKSIVVERDGVVTMDGIRLPWTDVTGVSVYTAARSSPAVQINLTEEAWANQMSKQGRGGKILHGANKMITRNRGLIQPQYLDARPHELAAWMNQFARGVDVPATSQVAT